MHEAHLAAFGALETPAKLGPDEIEARARGLLAELTLAEKLGLMDGDLPFWRGLALMSAPGGYGSRVWVAGAVPRLGIPGIRFSDGPRGIVMAGATTFPVSMARGATFDVELEERVGDVIGRELRALGGNFFGGVCINLLRHPAWGRAQETYSEDSFHLGMMGSALARGVQRHVMACVKHYALNSMENARQTVDVSADARTMHEVYLAHFKRVVDAGVAAVMSAYNSVNGEWAGQNRALLTGILKQEWGFAGFVIFLISALAESNRSPFDLPEAESELVAGHLTEYSGFKYALFFMAEYFGMCALNGLGVTLFLGGWQAPCVFLDFIPSYVWFAVKLLGLLLGFIWIRATLPRLRMDQLMRFAWKFLVPLSLANLAVAALWQLGAGWSAPLQLVRWAMAGAILAGTFWALGRKLSTGFGPRVYQYAPS